MPETVARSGQQSASAAGGPQVTASVAVVGTGNIGIDLMHKPLRSATLRFDTMIGVDPASEGIAQARSLQVRVTHEGIDWLPAAPSAP